MAWKLSNGGISMKTKLFLALVTFVMAVFSQSSNAFADQYVEIQGTFSNLPGCAPALSVSGVNLKTHEQLELCTTYEGASKARFTDGASADALTDGKVYLIKGDIVGKGEVLAIKEIAGTAQN
jgi:hypothetical protein